MPIDILDAGKVRAELRRRKLTSRNLARRSRVHEVTVSRALHGQAVSAEVIYHIARELELAEVAR